MTSCWHCSCGRAKRSKTKHRIFIHSTQLLSSSSGIGPCKCFHAIVGLCARHHLVRLFQSSFEQSYCYFCTLSCTLWGHILNFVRAFAHAFFNLFQLQFSFCLDFIFYFVFFFSVWIVKEAVITLFNGKIEQIISSLYSFCAMSHIWFLNISYL